MSRSLQSLRNLRSTNTKLKTSLALIRPSQHKWQKTSLARNIRSISTRSIPSYHQQLSKFICRHTNSRKQLELAILPSKNKNESEKEKEENNMILNVSKNVIDNNNNNNNNNKAIIGSIPTLCVASALVTTTAGYTMSPATVTALSNFPLVAFAFMQASGISPIREIVNKQDTGDLNPLSFVMLYVNCAAWTEYGILINDFPIMLSNGVGICAGLAYTGIFSKYTKNTNMLPYYGASGAVIATVCSCPLWMNNIDSSITLLGSFGMTAAIILMSSPLSALQTVLKNKNTDAMPFLVSLAMTINGFGWMQYGILIKDDFYVYFPNGLGFLAGCVQLGFHAKYNRNSPFAQKSIDK